MMPSNEIRIIGLRTLPEVKPGDDLPGFIILAAEREGIGLQNGDVVVVTQKILSKAEGRLVNLKDVTPSPFAADFGERAGKDPRLVEMVLRESRRSVRMDRVLMIMETHHGFVCANAGIDRSNIPGEDIVSLLPVDPDKSAEGIRQAFEQRANVRTAVIISDSFGRPWREGITEVAIGVAGMDAMKSYMGVNDTEGHELLTTAVCFADELASAAGLVMEKISRVPVAIVRGYNYEPGTMGAQSLVRPPERDLFR